MNSDRRRRGLRGEGSVYFDRSRNRWRGAVDLPTIGGHRRRKLVSGKTEKEVTRKVRELLTMIDRGETIPDRRIAVAGLIDLWLAKGIRSGRSTNTKSNYASIANAQIKPRIGRLLVCDLLPSDVNAMLQAMLGEGLSNSTALRARSVLIMALRYAENESMVTRNVAELAYPVEPSPSEGRTLTVEQAKILLAAARESRLRAAVHLGLMLGLRPGEITGLQWSHVDLEAGTLAVKQSLKREKGPDGRQVLRLGKTKTKQTRMVKMPKVLTQELRAHRRRQLEEQMKARQTWEQTDFVFTTVVGTPIDPSNLRRAFAKLTDNAGLGHWTPYELRHSAVSILSAAGVAPEQIADLCGHGVGMTLSVYRHRPDPLVDAAEGPMDDLFGG